MSNAKRSPMARFSDLTRRTKERRSVGPKGRAAPAASITVRLESDWRRRAHHEVRHMWFRSDWSAWITDATTPELQDLKYEVERELTTRARA